jgi:hypothetical protein
MRYMIQVRFNGADTAIGRLPADEQAAIAADFEAIRKLPGVLDGNRLAAPGTARTVHVEEGETVVEHGPAVDVDSGLDGYYVYDAPNLDSALEFATRVPVVRLGGTVEIRPLLER